MSNNEEDCVTFNVDQVDLGEDACCADSAANNTEIKDEYCGVITDANDVRQKLTEMLALNPEDTTALVDRTTLQVENARRTGLKWKISIWVSIGRWRICITIRKK